MSQDDYPEDLPEESGYVLPQIPNVALGPVGDGRMPTGPRRQEVARLRGQGMKPGKIAETLGVSRMTVHRDLREPEVMERIQEYRTAGLEGLADTAREAASEALDVLREALHDDSVANRIRAAQAILTSVSPLFTMSNLNARLVQLEEEAGIRPSGPVSDSTAADTIP